MSENRNTAAGSAGFESGDDGCPTGA